MQTEASKEIVRVVTFESTAEAERASYESLVEEPGVSVTLSLKAFDWKPYDLIVEEVEDDDDEEEDDDEEDEERRRRRRGRVANRHRRERLPDGASGWVRKHRGITHGPKKTLMQHIDKISYAVAAVAGIALLVLAFTAGGETQKTKDELNAEIREMNDRAQNQALPAEPKTGLRQLVQSQWAAGRSSVANPTWSTDIAPAIVKVVKIVERAPAVHVAGTVEEIRVERDAEKKRPYLVVKGAMGADNEHVVIKEVVVYRSDGEGRPRFAQSIASPVAISSTATTTSSPARSTATSSRLSPSATRRLRTLCCRRPSTSLRVTQSARRRLSHTILTSRSAS